MGYELELSQIDHPKHQPQVRWLEAAASEANRQLNAAIQTNRQLRSFLELDDPLVLATEIRLAQARQKWVEALEALKGLSIEAD